VTQAFRGHPERDEEYPSSDRENAVDETAARSDLLADRLRRPPLPIAGGVGVRVRLSPQRGSD